jgi:hypothetical protein
MGSQYGIMSVDGGWVVTARLYISGTRYVEPVIMDPVSMDEAVKLRHEYNRKYWEAEKAKAA